MQSQSMQHQAWASGGAADDFFERNRGSLDADKPTSKSTLLFSSYIARADRVLEVGTANGRILEQLRRMTECEGYGIDPSQAAIADGQKRYPNLHLSVGMADRIEYPDGYFNVVLFGFCLYLIDRIFLMRVVAESDRILTADGGRLMITDFDPANPHRRPFKHHKGLWTYKMQYPDLWLANPNYVVAEKVPFSHEAEGFHVDPNERVASWILWKRDADAYPERP